jgi:adenylyltransferase/sulfurtransferase
VLSGKVLIFDAETLQSRIIKIGEVTKTHINYLTPTIDVPIITAKELESGSFELIDVRTIYERDLFDIGGKHIPVEEIEEDLAYFDDGKSRVLYCETGKRSGEAVKIIKQKYPQAKVFSLEGGLNTMKGF